jgi:hypothetical protein
MVLNIPTKLRLSDFLSTNISHFTTMVQLDFNLGELPYMAATHPRNGFGWLPEGLDNRRRYHWPILYSKTWTGKPHGSLNILPNEDKNSIWFAEKSSSIGVKEKYELGFSFGVKEPLESRIVKGDDIPLFGLPRISFGVSQPIPSRDQADSSTLTNKVERNDDSACLSHYYRHGSFHRRSQATRCTHRKGHRGIFPLDHQREENNPTISGSVSGETSGIRWEIYEGLRIDEGLRRYLDTILQIYMLPWS